MFFKLFLSSAGLVFVLAGCASQAAYTSYLRAQRKLVVAEYDGKDPEKLKVARQSLQEGKTFLDSARYDLAIRNFETAYRLSEESLALKSKKPALPAPAASMQPAPANSTSNGSSASAERPAMSAIPEGAVTEEVVQAAPPPIAVEKPQTEKRVLPKEVLQKYLANKRAHSVDKTTKAEPKKIADRLMAKPTPSKPAPKAPKKEASAASKAETNPALTPEGQSPPPPVPEPAELGAVGPKEKPEFPEAQPPGKEQLSEAKVIEVPAAPEQKRAPTEDLKPISPAAKSLAGGVRRKVPGAVPFSLNDATLKQQDAMTTLDQMSKFLLENPSVSLILQPRLADQEPPQLAEARFESIKSYLEGKGVPEDQVRMDPERRRASSGGFEMLILEH